MSKLKMFSHAPERVKALFGRYLDQLIAETTAAVVVTELIDPTPSAVAA